MSTSPAKEELKWLSRNPPLRDMMDRFPELWRRCGGNLIAALENGRAETLNELASSARSAAAVWETRLRQSRMNEKVVETALPHLVESRMILMALEKCYFAAATGKAFGRIRFNLINGIIIQKLLFERHLTRKPASLAWSRFWWPLLWQKRLLMPLVQPKGIFCFYSKKLVLELKALLAGYECLEIAAGDGTLARFLADCGVRIRATDNHSWGAVAYPDSVEKLDAKTALEKYQPEAVVCSWPPPANGFERHVFATGTVELYVVIGSRYRFASGNWECYETQHRFEWKTDERLSRYVLPPELDSAVLVFHRVGSRQGN